MLRACVGQFSTGLFQVDPAVGRNVIHEGCSAPVGADLEDVGAVASHSPIEEHGPVDDDPHRLQAFDFSGSELSGHGHHGMEEVPVPNSRLADGVDVGQPGQQFTERRGELTPGQLCAQTVVDSTAAERDVLVWRSGTGSAARDDRTPSVSMLAEVEHDHLVAPR